MISLKEKKVLSAQKFLKELGLDGWLLYDFHKKNELAHLFLEIPLGAKATRRFFYWIPKEGDPVRIVHAIESHILDGWPGEKRLFLSWQSLNKQLSTALAGSKRIAMEYSPKNSNPYVSNVDAGTVDLIRSMGIEVLSSGNFLPHFTSVIDATQGESHIRAAAALEQIVIGTWNWIGEHLKQNKSISEYLVQQKILKEFEKLDLVTDAPPIVAVNAHSADPHFETRVSESSEIKEGDFLLIDLWAKEKGDRAIFGDITRIAVASKRPTERQEKVFEIVRAAQKKGISFVKKAFEEGRTVLGFEVDDAVRKIIQKAGFGDSFIHRTGHNIGVHLHGSGAHIDNLEMHDDRPILPGTCFSIEPGIYLPGEFGVRLESDVYIDLSGSFKVTGGEQDKIHCII